MVNRRVPAAEYIRVSTHLQPHSIQSQQRAIKAFADTHGFEIIRTYKDLGKSGLSTKSRAGFTSLIGDTLSDTAQFRAIIVHDVSRWGRFQDLDEAAYYEFLCKKAGRPVYFCTERPVERPEGVSTAMITKYLHRFLAAEYSRELSVKCFKGQKRVAEKGFSTGSSAPFGYRRVAVSTDGTRRTVLMQGEHKGIPSDRISLALGPQHEIDCIKRIFRLFLQKRTTVNALANHLNALGIPSPHNKKWSQKEVFNILTNSKYVGCWVWNKTSWQLAGKVRRNDCCDWIVRPNAHPAIVAMSTFRKAQTLLEALRGRFSDQVLLQELRTLGSKHGRLTAHLIDASASMASSQTYVAHFGSLKNAYAKIGFRRKSR
jgi:DNA invertase Pin-like site-specific DNA recombinase